MGSKQIELYYSYRSGYSYLAVQRLIGWVRENDIDLQIRPVFPLALREPDIIQNSDPLRRPYMLLDCIRLAEFYEIPFRWANPDPVVVHYDPIQIASEQPFIYRLTRLAMLAAVRNKSLEFTLEVGALLWNGEVDDWSEGDHLKLAVARAGLDLDEMDEQIVSHQETLDKQLDVNQKEQRGAGHWGVPLMVFNDEPFWGQDRISLLQWRIKNSD